MWDLPRPGLWTRVPCIGRQILNHCATREAPELACFLKVESQREKEETKVIPRLQDWTVRAPFIIKENTEEKIIKNVPNYGFILNILWWKHLWTELYRGQHLELSGEQTGLGADADIFSVSLKPGEWVRSPLWFTQERRKRVRVELQNILT